MTSVPDTEMEDIYVLRSIPEQAVDSAERCVRSRIGFDPFPTAAARFFSFWSIRSQPADGLIVDSKQARVAEMHGCFGPTDERTRHNFYAEMTLGSIAFRGSGECSAVLTDFPEAGLFPVRCTLILSDLPPPFVGGLLTTSTITSKAPFGGRSEPPGYTQASIATLRLWKARNVR